MEADQETYFGDKDTFAIRCVPIRDCEYTPALPVTCHLVFKNQIIGNPDEPCYISSWLNKIDDYRGKLAAGMLSLKSGSFTTKTDQELFDLIWEADKTTKPFDSLIAENIWVLINCQLWLDETTEGYYLVMTECDEMVKFMWQTGSETQGLMSCVTVSKAFVITTISTATERLRFEFADILQFLEM